MLLSDLRDEEIRSALIDSLAVDGVVGCGTDATSPFVIQELPLRGGFVRADVAVIGPLALHIYEIKSDRDRLDRLPDQLRSYACVADHVTLVVGWAHAAEVLRTAPRWCEVWLAERTAEGKVNFIPLRACRANPDLSPNGLASLLSREEAVGILTQMEADVGFRSKRSDVLQARISEELLKSHRHPSLVLAQLRQLVHACLSRRDQTVERGSRKCDD